MRTRLGSARKSLRKKLLLTHKSLHAVCARLPRIYRRGEKSAESAEAFCRGTRERMQAAAASEAGAVSIMKDCRLSDMPVRVARLLSADKLPPTRMRLGRQ